MSDGMSDANAIGGLAHDVIEAAFGLRDSLQAAEEGHRGLSPSRYELQLRINEILHGVGWKLERLPGR